jgi:hypothetical protein
MSVTTTVKACGFVLLLLSFKEKCFTKKIQWNFHLPYNKFEVFLNSMFNFNDPKSISSVLNFLPIAFSSV